MTNHLPSADSDAGLPLSALLSHALVAFTIEFDNEFEHQMPHRTTHYGATSGSRDTPWLVSMAMWSNCMKCVGEAGVTVRDLERLARTKTNLNGMQRWGYIIIEPDPSDSRQKPPRSDWVIRATPAGQKAQGVWRPLFGTIEKRWQERFGIDEIGLLRESLWAVARQIDIDLPDCLPILGYGLLSKAPEEQQPETTTTNAPSEFPSSALLSKVLLAFALEFEQEADLSLAISANVLRLIGEDGVHVRDLPRLAGVSKESVVMALSFLEKHGYVVAQPESPSSRVKMLRLTPQGKLAQDMYHRLVRDIEGRWQTRFGKDTIRALRQSLEGLVGEPLFRGLEPYPDGWRASVPRPESLPYYPMVLHRGGFPDGS